MPNTLKQLAKFALIGAAFFGGLYILTPHTPTRRVFYSFHFDQDAWRSAQVRNIGVVEGDRPASDNDWEQVRRTNTTTITRWIDEQLNRRSCLIVLVGGQTANRDWVKYEIQRAWQLGKGVAGIYIHGLEDQYGMESTPGPNPFAYVTVNGQALSEIINLL